MRQRILSLFVCSTALIAGGLVPGCVSQKIHDEQLALCPEYFQQNVGEGHVLPFWTAILPLTGGPVGWLNKSDGSYSVTPLAGKFTILHEAFHSFDYRCAKERPDEWKRFIKDFCNGKDVPKPDLPAYLVGMTLPGIRDIPVKGHVRLYGRATGAEDAADCFAFCIQGKSRDDPELMRKCGVVKQFAEGQYVSKAGSNETTALPNLAESGLTGAKAEGIDYPEKRLYISPSIKQQQDSRLSDRWLKLLAKTDPDFFRMLKVRSGDG
jgi:hypothetical protein